MRHRLSQLTLLLASLALAALVIGKTGPVALAKQPALMWINPLDLHATLGTLTLAPGNNPGLVLTTPLSTGDNLLVGLQVPPGFAVTGVRICYEPGAQLSSVGGVTLFQHSVPPTVPATVLLQETFVLVNNTPLCVDTTTAVSVDPRESGPLFLRMTIHYIAAESITIRGVGLHLDPVGGG
jgi:hypothetical protein